jgi:hypothetical protein
VQKQYSNLKKNHSLEDALKKPISDSNTGALD